VKVELGGISLLAVDGSECELAARQARLHKGMLVKARCADVTAWLELAELSFDIAMWQAGELLRLQRRIFDSWVMESGSDVPAGALAIGSAAPKKEREVRAARLTMVDPVVEVMLGKVAEIEGLERLWGGGKRRQLEQMYRQTGAIEYQWFLVQELVVLVQRLSLADAL
jgi:hypothetical protein